MKIVNQPLIESFRTPGPCRFCQKEVRMRCAAHIFSKGAGRVDLRCNLVQLGMDALTDCPCHTYSHNGHQPTLDDMLAMSAADNKCRPEDIHQVVYFIRRLDKSTTGRNLLAAARVELAGNAIGLLEREFDGFRELLG